MRFDGEWLRCEDGIIRPVIRADVLAATGHWRAFELLIDTGADRTVICASVLESLGIAPVATHQRIGGIGGVIDSVAVNTQIRIWRDDGQLAKFRGEYAGCTDRESLDMSVLGRDLLDMFTLIVDRQANIVSMIAGQHVWSITTQPPQP